MLFFIQKIAPFGWTTLQHKLFRYILLLIYLSALKLKNEFYFLKKIENEIIINIFTINNAIIIIDIVTRCGKWQDRFRILEREVVLNLCFLLSNLTKLKVQPFAFFFYSASGGGGGGGSNWLDFFLPEISVESMLNFKKLAFALFASISSDAHGSSRIFCWFSSEL